MELSIKPKALVLCDDIHREEGGKFVLAGVYTGGPIVHETPSYSQMHVFATFDIESVDAFDVDFAIIAENFVAQGMAKYPGEQGLRTVDLVLPFYTLIEDGIDIVFKWSVNGTGEHEVRWPVHISENATQLNEVRASRERRMFELKREGFFDTDYLNALEASPEVPGSSAVS